MGGNFPDCPRRLLEFVLTKQQIEVNMLGEQTRLRNKNYTKK